MEKELSRINTWDQQSATNAELGIRIYKTPSKLHASDLNQDAQSPRSQFIGVKL